MSKTPNVLPWSYSRLTAFETCARRFKLTALTKQIVEPQTEATLHGNAVHKALELHVKGEAQLPAKYDAYRPMADKLTMAPGKKLVEYKFGLTAGFKPTEFFGKDVWVRGVIDLGILGPKVATVLDYKTGKPKEDSAQLKLFAGVTFAAFPYIERVKTGFLWLAHDKTTTEEFTRDDVPRIWQEFNPRVIRMVKAQEEDKFPPNPSGLCQKWCPVPKSMCEFSGKQ